jgi:hypothetical protein
MLGRFTGLFIAAGFGVLFVLLNTGEPLAAPVSVALRVIAVLAFLALVGTAVLVSRPGPGSAPGTEPAGGVQMNQFGRGYWIVVAAEVVLLFGGFQVFRLLDAPAQARVAWVAVVVGLHFIAFLWVWKQPSILVPGVLLSGYGVAGLIMAWTSAAPWVPFVSGVLSGITLLACCLLVAGWAAVRRDPPSATEVAS